MAEKRIDFSYDADGQYATVTRYADLAGTELVATATYSFDGAYQLVGLTYTKGTTTLASYNYTFDAAGNMTSMTTVDGTTNYTSDPTGQLTAAGTDTYAYDSNGNRTTANGSTYVTGVNNELMDDGTYTYTYDAEGNRLTKTDKATGAETDYTWDYRDRLSSVTFKDSSGTVTETVYYQYDASNHLVGETVSVPGQADQQTVWVYDQNQIVSQFDGTGTSLTANNLSHRYLWNPQAVDQLFADEQLSPLPPGEGGGEGYDLTTPGNVLWALTDHENSVRDLATYDPGTDVTTIANHRVYDAYGNLTSQTNAAVDCLFGYTGRQFDEVAGLQNNLNRWYDPTVGRWLSDDPINFAGGDSNLYRYLGDDPLNHLDPTGTKVYGGAFNFAFVFCMGGQMTLYRLWDDQGRQAWVLGYSARVGVQGDLSLNGVISEGCLPDFIRGNTWDVSAGGKLGAGASGGYNTNSGWGGMGGVGIGAGVSGGWGGSQVIWKNW